MRKLNSWSYKSLFRQKYIRSISRPAEVRFSLVQVTFFSNVNLDLVVVPEPERNLELDRTNTFTEFGSEFGSSSNTFIKKLVGGLLYNGHCSDSYF
jgi:hypothetical protein